MSDTLLARHSRPVPRYTSYPTAPHFHAGIGDADYARWLGELPDETDLSLYVHVPFCDRLCWFCGCHTKQVLRYDPIAAYLPAVHAEMENVARLLAGRGQATRPAPGRRLALDAAARGPDRRWRGGRQNLFGVRRDFEFSIEIDPNDMTEDRYDAFAAAGVTRISVGVQDFDPQGAGGDQPHAELRADPRRGGGHARNAASTSANLDVLYGLPHQTVESVLGDHRAGAGACSRIGWRCSATPMCRG